VFWLWWIISYAFLTWNSPLAEKGPNNPVLVTGVWFFWKWSTKDQVTGFPVIELVYCV
jgi:hypothetical protein